MLGWGFMPKPLMSGPDSPGENTRTRMEMLPGAATTPTKCRVVGGLDEAMQAGREMPVREKIERRQHIKEGNPFFL